MDILIEEYEESLIAAALQDGKLQGFEIDPAEEEVRWGSVYYAKVKTLDPALDAAYLDLDGDNIGLIYNQDLRIKKKDGTIVKGGEKSIGKTLNPGDMIAVQAKTAYLPKEFDSDTPRENKIPQMSMDITMPGRYLIYCPTLERSRISQRIKDKTLRKQIRTMLEGIKESSGFIIRAAASGTQTDMLVNEAKILKSAWAEMETHFTGDSGQLIMLGPDAIQRTLSDHADKLIDRIEVVIMDHYTAVEEWCTVFAPDLVTKINPIEIDDALDDLALFYERDIMGQVESLFDSYCMLEHGANIIIQKTAALTAIDVNKGGDKRGHLATNIEAAAEIARQIRLRNIGGIIIIDFLKFKSKKEEGEIIAALEKAINQDPCTVQIHGKTALGLVEITRKRRTPPLDERFEMPYL
ncbi:ribonuclease E/G [Alphaproteobacteria bacterium]|nr:ribonuclease E/G [Alphaproteobacteria bacterium]